MRGIDANTVSARTIFPTARGNSLGTDATAGSYDENDAVQNADPRAVTTGGHPILWWLLLVGLFLGLGFLAQRYGSQGASFAHIKLSFYNVLITTLVVIIGLNFAKIVVTALPFVPKALKDVVLAA